MTDHNAAERQRHGGPSPWAGEDSRTEAQLQVMHRNLAAAEQITERVLDEFRQNQDKPVTDPTKTIFGPTLPQAIVAALVQAGLVDGCLPADRPGNQKTGPPVPAGPGHDWPEQARAAAIGAIDRRCGPGLRITVPATMYLASDILDAVAGIIRADERARLTAGTQTPPAAAGSAPDDRDIQVLEAVARLGSPSADELARDSYLDMPDACEVRGRLVTLHEAGLARRPSGAPALHEVTRAGREALFAWTDTRPDPVVTILRQTLEERRPHEGQ